MSSLDLAPASRNPEYLLPGTRIGLYEVVDLVGRGGFGSLYKVRREGQTFALKISHFAARDLGSDERDDFDARSRREMASLLSLRHPNIVEVLAFERWPDPRTGHPYIVMEFIEGDRLYEWRKRTRPSARSILHVFRKITLALAEMHRLEVYHRDLKSENILVRSADNEPIIVDFGVSRPRSAHTVTRADHVVGTYSHFSPEYCEHCRSEAFIKGERFVNRPTTEIHTVGFMLYQALTGQPPFEVDASDFINVIQVIAETVPERPLLLNPYIPEPLDRLVMRLLDKNPEARPQTADLLALELSQLLDAADANWDEPLEVPSRLKRRFRGTAGGGRVDATESLSPQPIEIVASADILSASPKSPLPTPSNPGQPSAAKAMEGEREAALGFVPATDVQPAFQESAKPEIPPVSSGNSSLRARILAAQGRVKAAIERRPARGIHFAIGGTGLVFVLVVSLAALGRRDEAERPRSLLTQLEGAPEGTLPSTGPSVAPADRALGTPGFTQRRENQRAEILPDTPPSKRAPSGPRVPEAGPSWISRAQRMNEKDKRASRRSKLGIPYGTHLKARLRTNLDSRTVGYGPAEALLTKPVTVNGTVALPAQTRLFGQARANGDRFTVAFDRLQLPGGVELHFKGHAEDASDENKPGLPPSRRILGAKRREPGVASKVAKGTAHQLLSQVTGGSGQDVVRGAGQTALDGTSDDASFSGDALFLDSGAELGVFVEEAL